MNREEDEVRHRIAAEYDRVIIGDAVCCEPLNANAAVPPTHHRSTSAVSYGCGSPVAISDLQPGDVVLDLGCGAGPDLLWAAAEVGPTGRVLGVEASDEMVYRARLNVAASGFDNVEVCKGIAEALPVAAESVDWVISDCVINLSPNKPQVFAEIARVLKPGGRMRVADVVVDDLPEWLRRDLALCASCIGGAISEHNYVSGLCDAGLTDIALGGRYVYDRDQLAAIAAEAQDLNVESSRVADELVGRVWSVHIFATKPIAPTTDPPDSADTGQETAGAGPCGPTGATWMNRSWGVNDRGRLPTDTTSQSDR